jgi:hypothetical protein
MAQTRLCNLARLRLWGCWSLRRLVRLTLALAMMTLATLLTK